MKQPIISALIVDDEPLARKRMEKLLNGVDRISVDGLRVREERLFLKLTHDNLISFF